MTVKEFEKERRRIRRQELKTIEKRLHPTPCFRRLEILHEHKGQYIYFSAWSGNNKANSKWLKIHRTTVLYDDKFYLNNSEDFHWLAS